MFYKRIQAFGDSFTAGTELADGPVGDQNNDQLSYHLRVYLLLG